MAARAIPWTLRILAILFFIFLAIHFAGQILYAMQNLLAFGLVRIASIGLS
jgi:hypothetical protein